MFIIKIIIGITLGGSLGFGIGYYGQCQTGMCPLTSNPYISTALGILIGLAIAIEWAKG